MEEKAFPCFPDMGVAADSEGMNLRDYFAAKAMAALISHLTRGEDERLIPILSEDEKEGVIAQDAYEYADAMMEARKK